jgi:ABC-type uncharacterized transport system substrate-binding protein
MRRRQFLGVLSGAAVAWPLVARGQQQAPVVGFLGTQDAAGWNGYVNAFRQGLADLGFEDGRNVRIEFRWADGQSNRLPALTSDLVHAQASVIVPSVGSVAIRAARSASPTTPIVFVLGGDPVKLGFVSSLNRPDGNMTGVSFLLNILAAKRIALLHELVPGAAAIGLLVNPDNPNTEADTKDALEAAKQFGQQTHVVNARSERDFDSAFTSFSERRAGALFVASDPLFVGRRDRLVALAARHALPAIYDRREIADAGGLVSYGASFADAHRQAGIYVGRILKGAATSDLPVVQATKFQLVINLKTAKALNLAISATMLALADEVIE